MITKTAREIIKNATVMANAENSGYIDFGLATNLLNTNYKYLYNDIVKNSLQFTDSITVDEDTVLPSDCYQVLSVTRRDGTPIHQSSIVSHSDNGFYIQNGVIHIPKGLSGVTVTYATIPATVTAPLEWKEITNQSVIPTSNQPYFVDYDEGQVTITENSSKFLGKSVTISDMKFILDGEDVTEYLERDGTSIVNIQYHSPYIAVSYDDGRVLIFTGLYSSAEWNYRCIEGHDTLGKCVAMKTDDRTGFGLVFYDNDTGKYYYAPFVPDTILRYPNNTLFALLEYRLAFQIAGLLGLEPLMGFLDTMQKEAEQQFYNTLDVASNAHRVTKYNGHGRLV